MFESVKGKGKDSTSIPGASQWRFYYHRMYGKLSTTCSNADEVSQWGAPSCSRPKPATNNGVKDGRSNWLAVIPHPTQGSNPWTPRIARCKCSYKSQDLLQQVRREHATFGMPGQGTACAATVPTCRWRKDSQRQRLYHYRRMTV